MKTYRPVQNKGFAWGLGILIIISFIILLPTVISLSFGTHKYGLMIPMGLVFLIVLTTFGYFVWASKNLRYELEKDKLTIHWAFNKKEIQLKNICGINRAIGSSVIKIMGASWPGFHFGTFSNPTGKGSVNLFATQVYGDIIFLKTRWETIGITPENPEEFLEELGKNIPETNLEEGTILDAKQEIIKSKNGKIITAIFSFTLFVFIAAGTFLFRTIPTLPTKHIPMHYNIYGQVDRYGSPNEIFVPFGIGISVVLFLLAINYSIAKNNEASSYMIAFVSLFIALLFSAICIGMVLAV